MPLHGAAIVVGWRSGIERLCGRVRASCDDCAESDVFEALQADVFGAWAKASRVWRCGGPSLVFPATVFALACWWQIISIVLLVLAGVAIVLLKTVFGVI